MAITLHELNVAEVPYDGGYEVILYGVFSRLSRYHVYVGPNGDNTDPLALSGVAGLPHDITPINEQRLRFYTPILELGNASVYVMEVGSVEDGVLTDVLEVIEPVYRSLTFELRRVLPTNYALGPRKMELLHRVGDMKVYPVGLLEAVSSGIGDADNEIGGLYQTRLTAPVDVGDTTFPVESTYGFPDSGKIGLQGVTYRYTGKTGTSFTGVGYLLNGSLESGAAKLHREEATVVDLNKQRSAIELVRASMLVDYAEGEYLNALGRNLGVNRLPFLKSDDVFREIVKYLAYNPRGTIYGIELALTGLVGAGNFEVYENVMQYPCTVFIRLLGSATTEDFPFGKAYLEGNEYQLSTAINTVDINEEPVDRGCIQSVRLKDEDHTTFCETAYPSADSLEEYEGDTGTQLWALNGTGLTEGVDILLIGSCIEFQTPPVDMNLYSHAFRVQPESQAVFSLMASIPVGAPTDGSINTVMVLDDDERAIIVGIFANSAAQWQVGFVTGGAFIAGPADTFLRNTWHELTIKKSARNDVELWVDGNLKQTVPHASCTGTFGTPSVTFGHHSVSGANKLRVKHAAFFARTLTEYWSARGSSGAVSAANPQRLDTNSALMLAGDVGKQILTKGSTATNGDGGNNNGDWIVDSYVDTDNVELLGRQQYNATVQAAFPTRIVVPTRTQLFKFPDDLGKQIILEGSLLGNDGTFVIEDLLDPDTLTTLKAGATPIPATTNVCLVRNTNPPGGYPSFNTETGLNWRLQPVFVNETGLDWELAEAGSRAGTTLTLRQSLPLHPVVLAVRYSQLLSAQLLFDNNVLNALLQEVPDLIYQYYPFYLSDPLGFVRQYLDDITAAGVIPDYEIV